MWEVIYLFDIIKWHFYYNSITNGRDPIFVYYVQNELIVPIHSSIWIYSLYTVYIYSLCSYGGNMWVFKINFIWYMYTHRYTYIELYLIAEVVLQTAQLYWHLQTSIYFTQLFSVTHVWFAWLSVDMGRACMGSAPDHRFTSDFLHLLFSELLICALLRAGISHSPQNWQKCAT